MAAGGAKRLLSVEMGTRDQRRCIQKPGLGMGKVRSCSRCRLGPRAREEVWMQPHWEEQPGSCSDVSGAWRLGAAGRAGPGGGLTDQGWHLGELRTASRSRGLKGGMWAGLGVVRILGFLAHTSPVLLVPWSTSPTPPL